MTRRTVEISGFGGMLDKPRAKTIIICFKDNFGLKGKFYLPKLFRIALHEPFVKQACDLMCSLR